MSGRVRVGISGWRYAGWRGGFYPIGLPQRSELAYAAERLDAVELNGSFYSLQRVTSWQRWHDAVPDDFEFAIKGSRYLTHMKKLTEPEAPLANFFAQGLLQLGAKLGPILWQFPERMPFDLDRFERFLSLLPRDTVEAAALAARHDHRMDGRTWRGPVVRRPLRHAVEMRAAAYFDARFLSLLRRHGVAWVVADTAGRWPEADDVTADFVYVRLHGAEALYTGGYADAALDRWAERIAAWRDGGELGDRRRVSGARPRRRPRDVYVFFDNDVKVDAPFDAMRLRERLARVV